MAKPAAVTDSQVPDQTVLVVEDEVLLRLVAADELRQQGYGVTEAANADEAMAVCERAPGSTSFLPTSNCRAPSTVLVWLVSYVPTCPDQRS